MKLCFIAAKGGGNFGGSEILWSSMALQAQKSGHDVTVSIPKDFKNCLPITSISNAGATVITRKEFSQHNLISKLKYKIAFRYPSYFNIYQEITTQDFDVIIVSQAGTYDAVSQNHLYNYLLHCNKPFYLISQFHKENGVLSQLIFDRARKLFPLAKKIFFVSKRNLKVCEMLIAQCISNSLVVSNPVKFTDRSLVKWPDLQKVAFACVARLDTAIKGQNLLIKLLSQHKWKERNWSLNFYGGGGDLDYLVKLSKFYGVSERVIFHGNVSNIRELWSQNHIMLLPSLAEGTPLALIEASVCGRPAVVTDVGDNAKLIMEGETGYVASCNSIAAFDSALEKAWQSRHAWEKMGKLAASFVSTVIDFNIEETLIESIIYENTKEA